MPKPHDPETPQARRNRALCREQRKGIDVVDDRRKSRYFDEIANTLDEGFSEQCANYGTNAGKHVNLRASYLPDKVYHGKELWDA